ncbi:MAG: hypothetical protein ACTSSJ_01410 [Candidatus Odinarchaeia archaeon]
MNDEEEFDDEFIDKSIEEILETEFTPGLIDDVFDDGELIANVDAETLYEYTEEIKPVRKIRLTDHYIEVSIPEKRMLRKVINHFYYVRWGDVKAYEIVKVNYDKNKRTLPVDFEIPERFKPIGVGYELFFFSLTNSGNWLAYNILLTKDEEDSSQIKEIFLKYTNRPQLPGLTHDGNTAAVRYAVEQSNVILETKLELKDWLESSLLVVPHSKDFERYRTKGEDFYPPRLIICEEGIAQLFPKEAPIFLKQQSVFWPWDKIEKVEKEEDSLVLKWKGEKYKFKQKISEQDKLNEIIETCRNALANFKEIEGSRKPFYIRANAFPSKYSDSWLHLEPLACSTSREGLPPKITDTE